jgi:ribA/ribD-fused uncharacterized protein
MWKEDELMQFREEFSFLSNFYIHPIIWGGREWATSEHAYQAAKTLVSEEVEQIAAAKSPGIAKRLGKSKEDGGIVTLRADWKAVRVGIMHSILEAKFSIPELEEKLLSTGKIRLIEGNVWKDTFWGVDMNTLVGQNMLGKLLMQIREDKINFG